MEDTIVGAFVGIGFLIIVNIATVAYSYGKLNQKVGDLNDELHRIVDEFHRHIATHSVGGMASSL